MFMGEGHKQGSGNGKQFSKGAGLANGNMKVIVKTIRFLTDVILTSQ